jgi:hypothetical protein
LQVRAGRFQFRALQVSIIISNLNAYNLSGDHGYIGAIAMDNDLRVWLFDGRRVKSGNTELDFFDPFDETLDIRYLVMADLSPGIM